MKTIFQSVLLALFIVLSTGSSAVFASEKFPETKLYVADYLYNQFGCLDFWKPLIKEARSEGFKFDDINRRLLKLKKNVSEQNFKVSFEVRDMVKSCVSIDGCKVDLQRTSDEAMIDLFDQSFGQYNFNSFIPYLTGQAKNLIMEIPLIISDEVKRDFNLNESWKDFYLVLTFSN